MFKSKSKSKIESIRLHDGHFTKIKYSYPKKALIEKLVIYVNGSGPNTYDIKHKWHDGTTSNYHDFFASEFNKRGIAYCRYNTRGVDTDKTPPLYAKINDDECKTYLPSNSVKDIETIINHLKQKDKFKSAKVYLLGWSEGTIIAPLVALNKNVKVDALLLAGYCIENLKDILTYQLQGYALFTYWRKVFDYDKKGYICKDDYLTDKYGVNMLKAIEENDDEWLKNNHKIRLTSGWFKEHFKLKANKEILPLLDLPIFIFHGEDDAMCTPEYAREIELKFRELNKRNLTVYMFDDHDHNLNYHLLHNKEISQGIQKIFEVVERL